MVGYHQAQWTALNPNSKYNADIPPLMKQAQDTD